MLGCAVMWYLFDNGSRIGTKGCENNVFNIDRRSVSN